MYQRKSVTDVSWYEASPVKSLQLIRASGVQLSEPIIDVGGGASFLVDALLDAGYRDLTVLDISNDVLQKVRERLSLRAQAVHLIQADVTAFEPPRRYALWHDRAVFHFLVQRVDQQRYVEVLRRSLRDNGQAIIATFGPDGPERCSGLPITRYDAATLAAVLGNELTLAESSLSLHRTPWDTEQQFVYCRFERVQV